MDNKRILNVYAPLLKSFISNAYQIIQIDGTNTSNRYINQIKDLWDVNYSQKEAQEIQEKYEKENRPISIEDYQQLFLSKINLSLFKENKKVLDDLFNDVTKVFAVLTKLNEMELAYSFDITGGAARDFISNKPIKDIDLMLSIENTDYNNRILKNLNDISFLKKYFKTDTIMNYLANIVNHGEDELYDYTKKKQELIALCFDDLIEEKFIFKEKERITSRDGTGDYRGLTKERLLGVFKLNKNKMKLNYPVDILLTDYNKIDFVKDFDFDFCKASFSLISSAYETSFPSNSLELISRFSAERGFWADLLNKKLTINVDKKSNIAIESSVKNHFKRMKEKYPDYEINVLYSEAFEENAKYAKYLALENEVSVKGFLKKALKI